MRVGYRLFLKIRSVIKMGNSFEQMKRQVLSQMVEKELFEELYQRGWEFRFKMKEGEINVVGRQEHRI